MVPNSWARRLHATFALQVRNHLGAKADGGTGRTKSSLIQGLGNGHCRPASFGQLLNLVTNLRIRRKLAERADGPDHDALGLVATEPLDPHLHLLGFSLHIDDDSPDDLP